MTLLRGQDSACWAYTTGRVNDSTENDSTGKTSLMQLGHLEAAPSPVAFANR